MVTAAFRHPAGTGLVVEVGPEYIGARPPVRNGRGVDERDVG